MPFPHLAIWFVFLAGIILMLARPRRIPEVWWVCGAAAILIVFRLISLKTAWHATAEGIDVYLFLTGMMLLAELAKSHGVFDWLATKATQRANGSASHLFTLIYAVGILVTVFLSNDATAVVLTPAVLAAVRKSKAEPLPYLLSCAFIANAASFVLPISNPANLVVFREDMPPLGHWLHLFLAASIVSILVTYVALRWCCRREIQERIQSDIADGELSAPGKLAIAGIALVAAVLLTASALGKDLGLPTCIAALLTTLIICAKEKASPLPLLKEISWSVLPLVAGLFILVEAIHQAGALRILQQLLHAARNLHPIAGLLTASLGVGIGTNLINNLPLGLIAGTSLREAILIGVDLGPNLSVTGSLATILWLIAIRKEGLHISARKFFRTGMLVMPAAMILAVLAVAAMQ